MITELLKRKNKLLVLGVFFFTACSSQQDIIGAKWTGDSDFMFVTENEMRMYYATKVSGKTAFIVKGNNQIGYIGSLHPKLVDELDLKQDVHFFEMQVEKISLNRKVKFKNFSDHQTVCPSGSAPPGKFSKILVQHHSQKKSAKR